MVDESGKLKYDTWKCDRWPISYGERMSFEYNIWQCDKCDTWVWYLKMKQVWHLEVRQISV